MNHRLIQRSYFRMLFDESFRARVLAGDRSAEAGLDEREFALLSGLDPVALGADPGDSRRRQAMGNILGEFGLTTAAAPESWRARGFPLEFFASAEFHRAIRADRSLPLAFGSWLLGRFGSGRGIAVEFLKLEVAMARCRRESRNPPALGQDEVLLAPGCALHDAPEGLAALAADARLRLAEDLPLAVLPPLALARGIVLLKPRPVTRFQALAEVDVEDLNPAVAGLLELARQALSPARRVSYAEALGVDAPSIEEFVAELVACGILIRSR